MAIDNYTTARIGDGAERGSTAPPGYQSPADFE